MVCRHFVTRGRDRSPANSRNPTPQPPRRRLEARLGAWLVRVNEHDRAAPERPSGAARRRVAGRRTGWRAGKWWRSVTENEKAWQKWGDFFWGGVRVGVVEASRVFWTDVLKHRGCSGPSNLGRSRALGVTSCGRSVALFSRACTCVRFPHLLAPSAPSCDLSPSAGTSPCVMRACAPSTRARSNTARHPSPCVCSLRSRA